MTAHRISDGQGADRRTAIRIADVSGITVIELFDSLDTRSVDDVASQLLAAIPRHGRMLIDGNQLGYLGAAGARLLLAALARADAHGTAVALCGFHGQAAGCLSVAGLEGLVEIVQSREVALAAFDRR